VQAQNNLRKESISAKSITVTGNTVIDTLFLLKKDEEFINRILRNLPEKKRIILVTAHRRENFGRPLINICNALATIARRNNDVVIVYPVHLNPEVLIPVKSRLKNIKNVLLIPPLGYHDFIRLMHRAYFILTDSGGIQEEAPSLGKPVLILRDKTERPEVVSAGNAKIIGTDVIKIVSNCQRLLDSKKIYSQMSKKRNIFGNGRSAVKIKKRIDDFLRRQ